MTTSRGEPGIAIDPDCEWRRPIACGPTRVNRGAARSLAGAKSDKSFCFFFQKEGFLFFFEKKEPKNFCLFDLR